MWYLGEQCEQVFLVRDLQVFGVKTMQPGNIALAHFFFLIVYVLHVCYKMRDLHFTLDCTSLIDDY